MGHIYGFTSVSPSSYITCPYCLIEGDLRVNEQTFILPLNNHNYRYLFYFASIFLILILRISYFHPYTSSPFFCPYTSFIFMTVMCYVFPFLYRLVTCHFLCVRLCTIGRRMNFGNKYLILNIYNTLLEFRHRLSLQEAYVIPYHNNTNKSFK